ncbi:hypothetical protein VN97_g6866 [Penicillium thymicola]|uniref:Uncharacterized protein n=1 Tax=Penicillium thymicola TaxID=293382 RepID=A0AAI9TG54_PENTH|nr:hypothetical protein VN97_g6866 [Penicillium thymicola]
MSLSRRGFDSLYPTSKQSVGRFCGPKKSLGPNIYYRCSDNRTFRLSLPRCSVSTRLDYNSDHERSCAHPYGRLSMHTTLSLVYIARQ